ncbi:MAG: DUF6057 family protein, partial [Tannerella sp.]|nr:DUF6057 family protein [Tannerella sp.]
MKKRLTVSTLNLILTLALGAGAFVFFGCFYKYHLIYQEQFQMFMFTFEYLSDTLSSPGGLAEYISRLLTQFYLTPWLGAGIIAGLLALVQRQILSIVSRIRKQTDLLPLTFVPSLLTSSLIHPNPKFTIKERGDEFVSCRK